MLESGSETSGKIIERHGMIEITRRMERECSLMKVNGLRQVRQDSLLLKSVLETGGKVAERGGLIRMTRGTKYKCSSMKVNDLIQVR
jgi:hypothetical protein